MLSIVAILSRTIFYLKISNSPTNYNNNNTNKFPLNEKIFECNCDIIGKLITLLWKTVYDKQRYISMGK